MTLQSLWKILKLITLQWFLIKKEPPIREKVRLKWFFERKSDHLGGWVFRVSRTHINTFSLTYYFERPKGYSSLPFITLQHIDGKWVPSNLAHAVELLSKANSQRLYDHTPGGICTPSQGINYSPDSCADFKDFDIVEHLGPVLIIGAIIIYLLIMMPPHILFSIGVMATFILFAYITM